MPPTTTPLHKNGFRMAVSEEMHDVAFAEKCVNYLQQEDAYLDELHQSIKSIRSALLSREFDDLETELRTSSVERPTELRDLQREVRKQLAVHLSVAESEVGLEDVAAYAGSNKDGEFAEKVKSMRRLRREIGALNSSNIAVSLALSRMVDRFIQQVTGVRSISTYGRTGEVERRGHYRVESSS